MDPITAVAMCIAELTKFANTALEAATPDQKAALIQRHLDRLDRLDKFFHIGA